MLRAPLILSLAALAAGCAAAPGAPTMASLPMAPAEELGFTADGLAALDAHFTELAANRTRAGFVIGVARDGQLVHELATGMADVEAGRPMDFDTRFRLASMSKPITVAAALTLVDAGKIGLDDPVSDYIPEFANMTVATSTSANPDGSFDTVPQASPMTIRHLMTHTSGLGYALEGQTDLGRAYLANTLYDGDGTLAESMVQLSEMPLYFQPGEQWFYSWAIDALGRVVEVASGMAFDDYLDAALFTPLGMTSTHFYRTPEDEGRLATVYGHDAGGALEPAAQVVFGAGDETFPSGGGGLISTMPDYLRFASMLAGGGALGDVRVLSPEAVALMGSAQLEASQYPRPSTFGGTFLGWSTEGRNFGLGVQVTTDAALTPQDDRDGDFGWNGAYTTDFFVSPSTGVAAVVMLQSAGGPARPPVDVGGDLRRFVYGALAE